jgi:acetyltransferase
MSVRNLRKLFRPASVAVVGATNRPDTVGRQVMRNLLLGGFKGPVMPVNPKHDSVQGVLAYADVDALPVVPDLAVICVPPDEVPGTLGRLARRGCGAAVILTSGVSATAALGERSDGAAGADGSSLLAIAREHGMRLLGPNSLGLLVPGMGLNASLSPQPAHAGRIAFVSQSGALGAAILDWAQPRGIGFSCFVALGDGADADFGDVLDYLGSDPDSRAILLYVESIREARAFLSAARAAARNKPVLVIKAGRYAEADERAELPSGLASVAGTDAVYDAALQRAGMLRVYDVEELFAAVETLSVVNRPKGERLAILTNSRGIGTMAMDVLRDLNGTPARFDGETAAKLAAILPKGRPAENPVDLMGDAGAARYTDALTVLAQTRDVDAVLVMHAPLGATSPTDLADQVIAVARQNRRASISTCWVGEALVAEARGRFHAAGLPTFETPHQAVQAFMHTVQYRRNQDVLMETPASMPTDFLPNSAMARQLVRQVLAEGRETMTEAEGKAVLAAYGVPTVETHVARTPEDCRRIAADMGGLVALKVMSPDIHYKTERGAVRLNIDSPEECEQAARKMLRRLAEALPEARIDGFTVQRMERRPGAHELTVGMACDPVFGPVLIFGQGGTAADVVADRAAALPPLNMALARDLISRTRVARLLRGYRGHPAAALDALCLTLIQVAQLVVDIPEITRIDIDPLITDHAGVIALDARVAVAPSAVTDGAARLAIRPYPRELEETFVMRGGRTVLLRPIRPEDEPDHHVFVSRLTPEDIRFRFFGLVHELPHSQMARLTQIDYDREMAFIATAEGEDGTPETLGVVRAVTDPDNETTEFSIVVRSDLKGTGLAKALMLKQIRYCRDCGTRTMVGQVLKDNHRMLSFIESLGFRRLRSVDADVAEVELDLQRPPVAAPAIPG